MTTAKQARSTASRLTHEDALPMQMLTAAEVLEMLRVSQPTLARWVKQLGFPAPKYLGGRRMWRLSELRDWINAQPDEPEHRPELEAGREKLHADRRQGGDA